MVTILEALTRPGPLLDAHEVRPGPNTTAVDGAVAPDGWVPWAEFNYNNLTNIFSGQLRGRYRGPSRDDANALPLDLRICNEETLQAAFLRFLMPTVNCCLDGLDGGCHYGPGTRCPAAVKPDWSCIAHGQYVNYVPGDTKLGAKFSPDMIKSDLDNDIEEWRKVLAQVTHYMAHFSSRYGFIITDMDLVVLRISRLRTGHVFGGTGRRPRRSAIYYVANYTLHDDADSSFANTTASYADDNPVNWDFEPPDYAVIPWGEHRPGRLTVKLALWCLAMMAANGGCDIDYSYPALDSWRKEHSSKYVHNASGATKKRAGRHDKVEGPDPAGAAAATLGAAGPSVGARDYYEDEDGAQASGSGGTAIQHDSDGEEDDGEEEDDPAYFSQAGTAAPRDNDQEASGTTFRQRHDKDEDDGDVETVVPAPKRVTVSVKKRLITRGLYYIDARGREVDTDRSDWRRASNGYELQGRKHTYFTKSFPG